MVSIRREIEVPVDHTHSQAFSGEMRKYISNVEEEELGLLSPDELVSSYRKAALGHIIRGQDIKGQRRSRYDMEENGHWHW